MINGSDSLKVQYRIKSSWLSGNGIKLSRSAAVNIERRGIVQSAFRKY
jgi:hypothetical protein